MKRFINVLLKINMLLLISLAGISQNKNDLSMEVASEYGFGKYFNNRAMSMGLNYNLFDRLKIAPAYAFYIEQDNMKMNSLTIDFIYLFTDATNYLFPTLKNKGISYYPIFGICIVNASGVRTYCPSCAANERPYNNDLDSNFGFDFGVGVEYKLPTLQNIYRNMSLTYDMKYIAVENNYRPLLKFGLLYYF